MENLPKQEDLNVFAKLLKAAFLEMHEVIMKLMLSKPQYIPDFYQYPTVSFPWSNGMPSFSKITDSRESQYFRYSVLLPHGGGLLGAMLSKTQVEIAYLPEFQKLRDWIPSCPELFDYFDNG